MVDTGVLPGFLLAVLLVSLAPGPDNAYVAAVALSRGARAGLVSALGMSLGMVVHVCAVAFGLAALLRSTPEALVAIRFLGAAYLGWLAVTTWRSDDRGLAVDPKSDRGLVWRAAVTNVTNPKVIIFFAAFLPQFTRPDHGLVVLQLLALGGLFLLVGLFCDSIVALCAAHLAMAGRSSGKFTQGLAALTFATLATALLVEAMRGQTP